MNEIHPEQGIDIMDELKRTYTYSIVAGVVMVAAPAALAALGTAIGL
jgi:hypothetical protein